MSATSILLLLFSIVFAGAIAYFQYFFKNNDKAKYNYYLALLRFLSVFGLLLLLINFIITRNSYENVKTPLPIVVDNSLSISELKANQSAKSIFESLASNSKLKEKFDIQLYSFDSDFSTVENAEKLTFKGKESRIDYVAKNLKSINKNLVFPTILISDGNQTQGDDFVFAFDANNRVYPVVVGDTTTYLDLKIGQINANKYAFKKNKFPVEVFLQYVGNKPITANFSISQGNTVLVKQAVTFSASKKSEVVNVLLPADKIGMQIFNATISSSEKEKNTYNNSKKFAVEIIDQRTEVAVVSAINHPDLGALRRGIESNGQRKVTIVKPSELEDLGKYNVLVLYQPNQEFKKIFDINKNLKINTWIITGNNTDFNLLNQNQSVYSFKMASQKEDFLANFESDFNLFALDNLGFESLPPLENPFGTITENSNANTLLSSRIRNVNTDMPLLSFTENQNGRMAFLFGENIWKWRSHSYLDKKSFEEFDVFVDKCIQYLASNNAKKKLVVNHERFYNTGDAIEITAQYFDKNYEFDEDAKLTISVFNSQTKQTKKYDLLKSTNSFKVNLDGLAAGKYSFAVKELNSGATYQGNFEVIEFNIEKQFVNPDLIKLNQLVNQTQGKVFSPNQMAALVKTLLDNPEYKELQKNVVKRNPLIDWKWILLLIAAALSAEWFLRKYHGLL